MYTLVDHLVLVGSQLCSRSISSL